MELNIKGRNVTVSEKFKEHVESKSGRFEQLGDRIQGVEVKVSKDHPGQGHQGMRVEITVIAPGPVLRAEARNDDKFAAFDEAYAKLVERLRRARDRRKVHRAGHQRPEAVREIVAPLPAEERSSTLLTGSQLSEAEDVAFSAEYPLSDTPSSPIEIRRKRFPAAQLSVDEAVDQMELVGHDFFLFVDKETNEPSAVYRRKGWEYGVISLNADGSQEEEPKRSYQPSASAK